MNQKKISRFLSLVLRHKPEKIDLHLDKNGWADVNELIDKIDDLDLNVLKSVVKENDKQRFSFNEDFTKIRANQGHSIKVDVQLKSKIPPVILYHGTAEKNIKSIMKKGLEKRNRNHVHLSADEATAINVGQRHGKVKVLQINCKEMVKDGIKFYLSNNNVWLTEFIDPKYIKL